MIWFIVIGCNFYYHTLLYITLWYNYSNLYYSITQITLQINIKIFLQAQTTGLKNICRWEEIPFPSGEKSRSLWLFLSRSAAHSFPLLWSQQTDPRRFSIYAATALTNLDNSGYLTRTSSGSFSHSSSSSQSSVRTATAAHRDRLQISCSRGVDRSVVF